MSIDLTDTYAVIFFVVPLLLILVTITAALYAPFGMAVEDRFGVRLPGSPSGTEKPPRRHLWIDRLFGYRMLRYWLTVLTVALVSAITLLWSPNDNVAVLAALAIPVLVMVMIALVARSWPRRSRHLIEASQFERLRPIATKTIYQIGAVLQTELGTIIRPVRSNWSAGQRGTLRLPGYLSIEHTSISIDGHAYYRVVLSFLPASRDARLPRPARDQMNSLRRLLVTA